MVETYNLKNTNTGKYKSIKNPFARGKAGIFCRTRQKAFDSLRLKNQTQNVKNQSDVYDSVCLAHILD